MRISNLNFDKKINPDLCGLPLNMRCNPPKEGPFANGCVRCPCSLKNIHPFLSVWDVLRFSKEIIQKEINKEKEEKEEDHPLAVMIACMKKGYPLSDTWRSCKCGRNIEAPFSIEGSVELFEEWHKIYGGPEKIKTTDECFFCWKEKRE